MQCYHPPICQLAHFSSATCHVLRNGWFMSYELQAMHSPLLFHLAHHSRTFTHGGCLFLPGGSLSRRIRRRYPHPRGMKLRPNCTWPAMTRRLRRQRPRWTSPRSRLSSMRSTKSWTIWTHMKDGVTARGGMVMVRTKTRISRLPTSLQTL